MRFQLTTNASIWTACAIVSGSVGCTSLSLAMVGESVQSAPAGIANRPASVPDSYVATPFGYFHPSCVLKLVTGETLLPDGRVQRADGEVSQNAVSCNYPHYAPSGAIVDLGQASGNRQNNNELNPESAPELSGWLKNANVATGSTAKSYGGLIAAWVVPPQPKANDGQVLFFFPGLEDIYATQSILQPVLTWSNGWSIASWNCCMNGVVAESPTVTVEPGDAIYGSITSTCPAGALACSTWNVLSLDMSSGKSTILANTPSKGQSFDWAFGGVLEPYYVVACGDFPPDHYIAFESITIFDENLHPVKDPKWSTASNSTGTPQCGYGVKALDQAVTLSY